MEAPGKRNFSIRLEPKKHKEVIVYIHKIHAQKLLFGMGYSIYYWRVIVCLVYSASFLFKNGI